MTTIAWDGKTLAADTLSVTGTLRGQEHKIHKIKLRSFYPFALAGAGEWWRILELRDWLIGDVAAFERKVPWLTGSEDEPAAILVCMADAKDLGTKAGDAWFLDGPRLERLSRPFLAYGSGKQFAMGAMAHGASAIEAVAIAARLDCYSGGEVDWVDVTGGRA